MPVWIWSGLAAAALLAVPAPVPVLRLEPGLDNPRNSEGDFIRLTDGGLLFVYTHFTGGAADHAAAHLAARVSTDDGVTWSAADRLVLPNEAGLNVMSVSLLRLDAETLGLVYLRKQSNTDCRPYLRRSTDEGATWGEAQPVVPDAAVGYYVLNNDRVVRLGTGRLVAPLAQHARPGQDWSAAADILCYLSDDNGHTWYAGEVVPETPGPNGQRVVLQEPGVVELSDGRLWMFIRTNAGVQFGATSVDGGVTWSATAPTDLASPLSPASIERLPSGELLAVWNDTSGVPPERRNWRTPLVCAVSTDDGATWHARRVLHDDPNGWYCYTAIEPVDEAVLLAYCAGDRRTGGLNTTQVTRVPLAWLRGEGDP